MVIRRAWPIRSATHPPQTQPSAPIPIAPYAMSPTSRVVDAPAMALRAASLAATKAPIHVQNA